jgi:DNA (cytosine-5)-methyltransferase 1
MTHKPRLLDLFCGRLGWSKVFLARGWVCVGVDLVEPPEIPAGAQFIKMDILELGQVRTLLDEQFDFICASSPCEEFSVHGMKHFHPNPKYPELGIKLFNHTRALCESSGLPYVMENVRPAQKFVGPANHHCGPFYLWGNATPPCCLRELPRGSMSGRRRW